MAIIRVKRGSTKPTTSNMSHLGELAFDYTNEVLYARGQSSVVKIGGNFERVYQSEASSTYRSFSYDFDPDYIYKVHVIAGTYGNSNDSSDTFIYYRTSSSSNLYGSYVSHHVNTENTTHTKASNSNQYRFYIEDSYVSGPSITSGITKVIDFEISPTFKKNYLDTEQWVIYGKSITTNNDQNDASIKMVDFAHSVNGNLGGLYINPGVSIGIPDSISVTIFRMKRK